MRKTTKEDLFIYRKLYKLISNLNTEANKHQIKFFKRFNYDYAESKGIIPSSKKPSKDKEGIMKKVFYYIKKISYKKFNKKFKAPLNYLKKNLENFENKKEINQIINLEGYPILKEAFLNGLENVSKDKNFFSEIYGLSRRLTSISNEINLSSANQNLNHNYIAKDFQGVFIDEEINNTTLSLKPTNSSTELENYEFIKKNLKGYVPQKSSDLLKNLLKGTVSKVSLFNGTHITVSEGEFKLSTEL